MLGLKPVAYRCGRFFKAVIIKKKFGPEFLFLENVHFWKFVVKMFLRKKFEAGICEQFSKPLIIGH